MNTRRDPPAAGRIEARTETSLEGSMGAQGTRRHETDGIAVGEAQRSGRSEREFLRADRHSRWVRRLKIGLPAIATVIVVGALAVTWLARALPADVAFASTSIVDGRLVMQDPRMSGVDGNNRPYSMVAARAIQALGGSGIDLEGVRANLTIGDDTTAELQATKGRYDTQGNMLRLYDDITVEASNGVRMTLRSADVSLADGQMTGSGPVSITTPSQRLEAGNLVVTQSGRSLSFRDRVKLTLLPTASSASPSSPLPGAEPPSSEPKP